MKVHSNKNTAYDESDQKNYYSGVACCLAHWGQMLTVSGLLTITSTVTVSLWMANVLSEMINKQRDHIHNMTETLLNGKLRKRHTA